MAPVDEDDAEQPGKERLGTVLRGKYRLDRVLGSGGMAVVYEATHRNKKRFAVKLLHAGISIRKDMRERFLREGYVANTVDHPGAVAVLDDDIAEDGAAFLVMELLVGRTLEGVQEDRGGFLDARTVLAAAHQVLDVLASAHARSIVHRDIKPANLFVTTDGTVKVLDFGIARVREALGGGSSATATGAMLGTPAFMAPEQAAGRASLVDGATDVWAVGATMFTTLTGQEVHLGETAQHVALLSATVPARSVTDLMPGLDAHIASVIDRALAFDKASRWPDAATMRDAVADAYASSFGEPIGRGPLGGGAGVGATTGSSVVQDESVDVRAHAATAVGPEGQPPRQPPVTPARERRDRAGMRRVGMSTEEPVSGMPLTGRTSGAVRGAVVLVALLSVGGVAIFLLRSRAPDGGGLASGVVASAWGAAAVPTSSPPREEPGAEPKAPPTSNTANTAPSSVTAPSAAHPAHAHDAGSAKPKTKDWDLQ